MRSLGDAAALVIALLGSMVLPAVIGVLVITHSPLQSIDPRSVGRFIRGCRASYAYAPLAAVLVVAVPMVLDFLPAWLRSLIEVYLLAAFFGGVIDTFLMRLADLVLLMPLIPVLIVVSSLFTVS